MKKTVYVVAAVLFFIALTGGIYYHNGLHERCPFCSTGKTLLKSFAIQSSLPQLCLLLILISQTSLYLNFSFEAQSVIDARAPPLVLP